jgi:hypothetical protein
VVDDPHHGFAMQPRRHKPRACVPVAVHHATWFESGLKKFVNAKTRRFRSFDRRVEG